MTLSNDALARIGSGISIGAVGALVHDTVGIGLVVIGFALMFLAVKRERRAESENDGDEVATDGGAVPEETPTEAAPEKPAVLDVDVVGDRALASVEKGDVSVVVEAPAGISAAELEQTLSGVPESIERTTERFAGATTMSANTTDFDGSTDAEETTDDDVGGGA